MKTGNRSGAYLAAGIVVTVLLLWWGQAFPQAAETADVEIVRLTDAVLRTGAAVESVALHYGTEFERVADVKELRALGDKLSRRLGMPGNGRLSTTDDVHPLFENRAVDGQDVLELRLVGIPADDGLRTYLIVRLTSTDRDYPALQARAEALAEKVKKIGVVPFFNTCVEGIYGDKLDSGWQKNRIFLILSSFQAKVVEKAEDETMQSVSAYSTYIKSFLYTNGMKMNLQVATRVDERKGQTRMTVGMPIITGEY
ncbi:hypothetical protein BSNK01_17510 [Bacillaceae bacterium]